MQLKSVGCKGPNEQENTIPGVGVEQIGHPVEKLLRAGDLVDPVEVRPRPGGHAGTVGRAERTQ